MSRIPVGEIARILRGGGPIGVLGPTGDWPPALRSTVQLLLGSTHPLTVCWGPELALLYNDAFVPGAGRKHPDGFGHPMRLVYPEIWEQVGPLVERVLHTGEPQGRQDDRLVLLRSGFAEETFWNYALSSLRDSTGRVVGVFNVTSETTGRVVGERRLRLLSRLAEAGRGADSVTAAVQRVAAVLGSAATDIGFAAFTRSGPGPEIEPVLAVGLAERAPALPVPAGPAFAVVELPGEVRTADGARCRVAAGATVPIAGAAAAGAGTGAGVAAGIGVLLGVPTTLPFDADQRSFLELVLDRVATAVATGAAAEAAGPAAAAGAAAEVAAAEAAAAEAVAVATVPEPAPPATRSPATGRADTVPDPVGGRLLIGIGEQLRTPLAQVLGPVERLRAGAPEELRADVAQLERTAARMRRLVDDLLETARLAGGPDPAGFAPLDLGPATAELVGMFRGTVERAGLILDVDCPPLPEPVWVDRRLWDKVVLQLLSNAVKHTFDGGIRVEVTADAGADPGYAELRVIDTGVGVPDAELPRLFDLFHRVPDVPARSTDGSGVGLSLVRRVVQLHGGTVEVTSSVGIGSVFIVRLPLGTAHLPAGVPAGPPAGTPAALPAAVDPELAEPFLVEARRWLADPVQDGLPDGTPEPELLAPAGPAAARILVADPDPDSRAQIARLLSEHGAVQAVADGPEAFAAATGEPPDLIVVDARIPGPDGLRPGGLGLVRALRAEPGTAGVPVVLMSAGDDDEAAVQAMAAGADDHLVTPISPRQLVARTGGHLHLGRIRRAAERRFRAMADATPALIWADDAGGQRQFVNRGWLDFTGAADQFVELGRAWQDRIHPDDRERYRSVRAAAAAAAVPFEVEYRLRHASGHHRWVLDRGAPVSAPRADAPPADARDRPTGFVGGCLDVDAQHRERRRNLLLADVATALDGEHTVAGRFRVLAATLVEHGVADLVRLHEHRPDGPPLLRAVAAADPALEADLRVYAADEEVLSGSISSGRARLVVPPEDHPLGLRSAVLAPLIAGNGRGLGVIGVGRTGEAPAYDAEDLDLLVEIGRRAGVAVDNARLLEQERASSQRLSLLHRATALMSAAATSQDVAAIAADQLATLLGCPFVGVWSGAGQGPLRLIATHGWTDRMPRRWQRMSRRSTTPAVRVFHQRRPMWLGDEPTWLAADRRTYEVVVEAGMLALGLIPLVVGDRCLGVIGVGFGGPHEFAPDERATAVAAVELAAQALDRSDLLLAETAARRTAERFGAVATALSRAVDLDAVARVTVTHARAAARASAAVVLVVGEGGQLVPMAAEAPGQQPMDAAELAPDVEHELREAVRTGEPVWTAAADRSVHPVHAAVPLVVGGRAIGVLGLRFDDPRAIDEHRRTMVLTLAGQCAQAVARARLHQTEHEMAVTLQRSLLPQQLPELPRLALAPRYVPGTAGTEAGGDWFDVIELDGADAPAPADVPGAPDGRPDGGPAAGGRVALVVGDVVGRGPAAAAVMGQLRSALAANLVNGASPAVALEQLDLFARRVRGARASTVACAVVELDTGRLRYACAGHPPPMVVDGPGAVRRLESGRGTPLGVVGRPPYVEAEDRLDPGSTVLLCSDGLFERRDEVIDEGLDRLAGVLAELPGAPEDIADELLNRMSAGRSAPDDVAFVLARLLPEPLRCRLPAQPEQLGVLRREVTDWCAAAGLGEDALTDLQLALGEAVTNSIEHAYRDRDPADRDRATVRVELDRDPAGGVAVRVTDSGHWRPPPADPGFRGRGLALIRDIAEDLAVDRHGDGDGEDDGGGTTVRFRMPPVPPPAPRYADPPTDPIVAAEPADPPPVPPPAGRTTLSRSTGPQGVLLHVDGDLDLAGVADVRSQVLAELARPGPLIVQLAADCWVSSAGVALLAELAQRSEHPLRVSTVEGSPARRMLALAGLDAVLRSG